MVQKGLGDGNEFQCHICQTIFGLMEEMKAYLISPAIPDVMETTPPMLVVEEGNIIHSDSNNESDTQTFNILHIFAMILILEGCFKIINSDCFPKQAVLEFQQMKAIEVIYHHLNSR